MPETTLAWESTPARGSTTTWKKPLPGTARMRDGLPRHRPEQGCFMTRLHRWIGLLWLLLTIATAAFAIVPTSRCSKVNFAGWKTSSTRSKMNSALKSSQLAECRGQQGNCCPPDVIYDGPVIAKPETRRGLGTGPTQENTTTRSCPPKRIPSVSPTGSTARCRRWLNRRSTKSSTTERRRSGRSGRGRGIRPDPFRNAAGAGRTVRNHDSARSAEPAG